MRALFSFLFPFFFLGECGREKRERSIRPADEKSRPRPEKSERARTGPWKESGAGAERDPGPGRRRLKCDWWLGKWRENQVVLEALAGELERGDRRGPASGLTLASEQDRGKNYF